MYNVLLCSFLLKLINKTLSILMGGGRDRWGFKTSLSEGLKTFNNFTFVSEKPWHLMDDK